MILFGVAYKKNVDHVRESPSTVLLEMFSDHGAEFSHSSLQVQVFPPMCQHSFDISAKPLMPDTLSAQDG